MADEQLDLAAIPGTAVKVLTSPAEFFRGMPKTGGFLAPLAFMVSMGVAAGLAQAALSIVGLRLGATLAMGIASIIVVPVLIAILGFVGAAIAFVIWKVLGSQEPYETSYRCVAYMSVLAPINVIVRPIPYLGPIATAVLFASFAAVASVEAHRIEARKAWAAFGAIGTLLAILGVISQLAVMRLRARSAQWQERMQAQIEDLKKHAEEAREAAQRQSPPPPTR